MAHRIILFASIGILFVHSSEETAPGIEQNKYETVPTTNINSNNAIVLEKESCVREGYHPAENLNECRMLVKKALEDGSIDPSLYDIKYLSSSNGWKNKSAPASGDVN